MKQRKTMKTKLKFANPQTNIIYDSLITRYGRATIDKKELATELNVSNATIDRHIRNGYNLPPYKKIGDPEVKNATMRWLLLDVAIFLSEGKVDMNHDLSFEMPELDLGKTDDFDFDVPVVELDIPDVELGKLDE